MAYPGIAGKTVLVTGGSSGIGQAIAIRMGQEGANVAINYYSDREEAEYTEDVVEEALAKCVYSLEEADARVITIQADVSQEDDVNGMFTETIERLGGIDILINNAGIQINAPSHEITRSQFERQIHVNMLGSFMCAQRAIQHFLAENKQGIIINVSSVHQIIPKPKYVGYSASKGGMQNLTRTLALEYAGRDIRVNAIGPGATITPINSGWVNDPEKKEMVESHIPMGRAAQAEEMAAVTAFLCSDDAAYITGQTLYVDGGLTLYPDFRTAWSSE